MKNVNSQRKVDEEIMSEIRKALMRAEETLGFNISPEDAVEVLKYSIRKCKLMNKDKSYLALLYETELLDHFYRMAINLGIVKEA